MANSTIQIRVHEKDKEIYKERAESLGMTLTQYIQHLILKDIMSK